MYSEVLFTSFVDHANGRGRSPWWLVEPPPRFWNSVPAPSFDLQEALVELRVIRVDALHVTATRRDTVVLVVELDQAGHAVITQRVDPG